MKKILILIIIFTGIIYSQTERIRGNLTTDKDLTFGGAVSSAFNLNGSQTINWDTTDTNGKKYGVFKDSLAADVDPSYTFTNITSDKWITVVLYTDGTNGITFPTGILWQGTTNVAPTSLQANSYNIFKFWKAGWMIFGISVGGFKYP